MKKINNINESSLSRLLTHMSAHDCGVITAERNGEGCKPGINERYTGKENAQRNRQLNAKLQVLGYGITRVNGTFVENYDPKDSTKGTNVYEDSYFVVDLEDTGNLKKDLLELGELYMQDSILWIPNPGDAAFLIGTNHCPDAFPGYINAYKYPIRSFGTEGEFMTMIDGRPLKFTASDVSEGVYNNYNNTNSLGKMATKRAAETDWRKLQV